LIVILDTNVWVSALQFGRPDSIPLRALQRALTEDTLATSPDLRDEIHRVLTRKFLWTEDRSASLLDRFLARAITVELANTTTVCRDPKDNMFLECASLAKADYLVAGDKDLLIPGSYANTRIITPLEYVDLIA
jgi:putative PIN family toxin of toxin-antitoxin system